MENAKDVMVGIMGASGVFAGLLLVFVGFIYSQHTEATPVRKYTRYGKFALLPFWGFLSTTLLALAWLIYPRYIHVYWTCIGLFIVLVVGTGLFGALGTRRVVKGLKQEEAKRATITLPN